MSDVFARFFTFVTGGFVRCCERSALLPSKLIKQWELPLFGFFTADACHHSCSLCDVVPPYLSNTTSCNAGGVDSCNDSSSSIVNQESMGSSHKPPSYKLHLLALRACSTMSDYKLALACSLFQQQHSVAPDASEAGAQTLSSLALPLLSSKCAAALCDKSQAEGDFGLDEAAEEDALQPLLSSNYIDVKQSTVPSFQMYESKFRFLDLQVPPILRPAMSCVFAAAIAAANAVSSDAQAPGSSSLLANSSAVHPLSLSPARHIQAEKQDKRPGSASARSSKQSFKRSKNSDAPFAVPSGRAPASTSSNSKVAPDISKSEVSADASVNRASHTLAASASVVDKRSSVAASSSHNLKAHKESPGYEPLKSKLWSKLHTKFRRETQPAVDIDLLKIVFNRCKTLVLSSTIFFSLWR
jgi:hypothetical protein